MVSLCSVLSDLAMPLGPNGPAAGQPPWPPKRTRELLRTRTTPRGLGEKLVLVCTLDEGLSPTKRASEL